MPYNVQFDLRGTQIKSNYNQISQFDTSSGIWYTGQGQSIDVSSSYAFSASNATSASYAVNSSNANTSSVTISSSYAINADTASYIIGAGSSLSSSWASQSLSSSYTVNADTSSVTISSSYAINADTSSITISSSYAISASDLTTYNTVFINGLTSSIGGVSPRTDFSGDSIRFSSNNGGYAGLSIFNVGNNYFNGGNVWNIVNYDSSSGNILGIQSFDPAGQILLISPGGANLIVGGGGSTSGVYIRIADDPISQGVEIGDGLGGQLNVASGAVGINTNVPAYTLDVNQRSGTASIVGNSGGDMNVGVFSSFAYFRNNYSSVGILTENPTYTLDVNGIIGNNNGDLIISSSTNNILLGGNVYCEVITASLNGTASYADTASFATTASFSVVNYVTQSVESASYSSASFSSSYALSASYALNADSASIIVGVPGPYYGQPQIDINGNSGSFIQISEAGDITLRPTAGRGTTIDSAVASISSDGVTGILLSTDAGSALSLGAGGLIDITDLSSAGIHLDGTGSAHFDGVMYGNGGGLTNITASYMPYSSSVQNVDISNPSTGSVYFEVDDPSNLLFIYNGTRWTSASMA